MQLRFDSIIPINSIIFRLLDEHAEEPHELDINCLDPLNRSALIIALEKENIDLIELLLERGIDVKVCHHYVSIIEMISNSQPLICRSCL